ncbi:MAG: histidine--tRNA ligase [Deltaproteobacteria bacterium]|nr:histidine--tRNA ligase [Deltaproteobacteria bacterium]
MEFTTLKGFRDILPDESARWQEIETIARALFSAFGYQEIKIPVLEKTDLFSRGIGQETDIVSKEMYSFADIKGRGLTMRPEATASVVRAYIQNRLYQNYPVQKLYVMGPMFRHERPQKGRFRQFHQIDVELFGDAGPMSDAEMIVLAMYFFESVGLRELTLHINSLGCPDCRPNFKEQLKSYLADKTSSLCPDCQKRAQLNPLRVFDCKVETCQSIVLNAPTIRAFLCGNCREHFHGLRTYLDGLNISYVVNEQLVRGLDYYNRTTFEIQTEHLGAQNAVAGGGRYDGLVKTLGGPDHPAIGFAVGVERVVALLEATKPTEPRKPDLFIAALGENVPLLSFQWMAALRKQGLWVELDYGGKGLKSQMKKADRLGARNVLIVGDDEAAAKKAVLRDMNTRKQIDVDFENLVTTLKDILQK